MRFSRRTIPITMLGGVAAAITTRATAQTAGKP
jgi:hypothetical protein